MQNLKIMLLKIHLWIKTILCPRSQFQIIKFTIVLIFHIYKNVTQFIVSPVMYANVQILDSFVSVWVCIFWAEGTKNNRENLLHTGNHSTSQGVQIIGHTKNRGCLVSRLCDHHCGCICCHCYCWRYCGCHIHIHHT